MSEILKFFCIPITFFISSAAVASNNPCEFLKKRKTPIVIHLNKNGEISKEKVNLGNLKFSSDFKAEYYRIPTAYKVIAYPRILFFQTMASGSGYVGLEQSKPLCPNTLTFNIKVYINFDKGDARPYKFNYRFPDVMMEDLPSTPAREANEILYFKPEVTGTIIQPTK
jgi:hypothetical protein